MMSLNKQHPVFRDEVRLEMVRTVLYAVGIGLLYLLVARLGLYFVSKPEGVAYFWPPSGLALAVLLFAKRDRLPFFFSALFVSNICANLFGQNSLPVSLAFAVANLAEAALVAGLVRYYFVKIGWGRKNPNPDKPVLVQEAGQVLSFSAIGVIANALTALLGAGAAAYFMGAEFWRVWITWYIADGLGMALITPLIASCLPAQSSPAKPALQKNRFWYYVEMAALIIGLGLISSTLFLSAASRLAGSSMRAYLLFPFLIWAGLRFSWRFVARLLAAIALVALVGTSNGLGQFSGQGQTPELRLQVLQLYLAVLIFTSYLLNSVVGDLKRVEENLKRSEAGFRSIFESASTGIFHSLPGAGFIKVNARLADMFGYSSPQELVESINSIPDQIYLDSQDYKKVLAQTQREPGWVYAVNNYRRKDGSLIIGSLSVRKVLNPDGSLAYLEGFVEDVTERYRAEQLLRASEADYRRLVENNHDIIYTLAIDGAFSYVSSVVTRLLGYTPQEVTGQLFVSFIHPDDQALCLAWLQEMIDNGQRQSGVEYRMRHADGSWKWHTSNLVPLCDDSGQVTGFEGTARDITNMKVAERVAQARLHLLSFADAHGPNDLLRATLDEAEALTGSQIGFFHFLEADQQTLSLQTWSTRTEGQYCKAQGAGMHYPISQAGVWVDCLYRREPVIHNDYSALPHRKGLPEGHAELRNELVTPVLRSELVVAVLGVGNKNGDYTQLDVSVVSQLADLAWDIVERKRAELALIKSETLLNQTQALSHTGGWEYDCIAEKMTWTREVYRIYGVNPGEFEPGNLVSILNFYFEEDRELVRQAFLASITLGEPFDLEMRLLNSENKVLWVRTRGDPVLENGRVLRVTGNIIDITESKQVQENMNLLNNQLQQQLAANELLQLQLMEQATHDDLTGLYNRRFMDEALQRELSRADRDDLPVSVLMLDIDHFKKFNDTFGHEAGDQVLEALGDLLQSHIRESDLACRYGGEEFVIILPGANASIAMQRAEHICASFAGLRIGPRELSATVSVGLAMYPQNGRNADELLSVADMAMYAAKSAGRNCVVAAGFTED